MTDTTQVSITDLAATVSADPKVRQTAIDRLFAKEEQQRVALAAKQATKRAQARTKALADAEADFADAKKKAEDVCEAKCDAAYDKREAKIKDAREARDATLAAINEAFNVVNIHDVIATVANGHADAPNGYGDATD